MLVGTLTGLAGWINNIIWTCHQTELGQVAFGIIGVIVAVVGAAHGIYLWF